MSNRSAPESLQNNLRFRRQFLLSTKQLNLAGLPMQENRFGDAFLYVHPELNLTFHVDEVNGTRLALLGFVMDPSRPDATDSDILALIANASSTTEELGEALYGLSGRFVLLVLRQDDLEIFHDPCGLRTVYYRKKNGNLSVGSSLSILSLETDIEIGERVRAYASSDYVRAKREHWLPAGVSLHEDVHQLVPNHYLRARDASQIRFWPSKALQPKERSAAAEQVAKLLSGSLAAAEERFDLSFPLTAGLDSRMLLSASRHVANSVFFYTLRYRDLDARSPDIRIPRRLLSRLGLKHNVIDCTLDATSDFAEIYMENTTPNHMNDWGKIAYGMLRGLPERHVAVKGNCAEITRCYLYPTGRHETPTGPNDITRRFRGWKEFPYIHVAVDGWMQETATVAERLGFNLLDLFHWELRQGGWQAQSQLEWDIAQEVFTPFNNRQLLDLMLSVPARHRIGPAHELQHEIMNLLWSQVLVEPINPRHRSVRSRVKSLVSRLLRRPRA